MSRQEGFHRRPDDREITAFAATILLEAVDMVGLLIEGEVNPPDHSTAAAVAMIAAGYALAGDIFRRARNMEKRITGRK